MTAYPKELTNPIFNGEYENRGIKLTGRPSDYDESIAEEIALRISNGATLISLCGKRVNEHDPSDKRKFPSMASVFRWLDKHESFREIYGRARLNQAHSFVEEAVTAVRNAATKDEAIIARVKADLLVRVAGKLNREAYGEHVKLEHKVPSHADLIAMAQKVYEAKKLEGKTIDLVPEITATEG